ncbi:hypothetical protein BC830DRAFT_1081520 [Chytriomyces sp. MP71]|nr:hypothetical protein BC830DRAFT_1081520 [Chytriomyces sp. MP71]
MSMDCGSAPYCGVLVLESGFGSGKYHHPTPAVHGLWPEIGSYGNSGCFNGNPNVAIPTVSCYTDSSFQQHEWTAHGVCASNDPVSFFYTVCNLSAAPLQIMTGLKSVSTMATALQKAGYPVWDSQAPNSQIYLSACAGKDGVWKLASTSNFGSVCGNTPPPPSSSTVKTTTKAAPSSSESAAVTSTRSACSHNECSPGGRLVATCSACAATVCKIDSYCCQTGWDSIPHNNAVP